MIGPDEPQEWWARRLLLQRYDAWLVRQLRPHLGKRILEVGCGAGNMTARLLDLGQVLAVDLSLANVNAVETQLARRRGLQTMVADITADKAVALRAYAPDSAVCSNLLEHVADDGRALENLHAVLPSGGRLAIVAPGHAWLYGSLDRAAGHYRRYSPGELASKVVAAGFEVILARQVNFVGVFGWFINARLFRRRQLPSLQLRIFDLLSPLTMAIEERLAVPLGLSILMIAERRARSAEA